MTRTLARSLALAGVPRRSLALAAALGALTLLFGVGLMATAGYLISRAAEQPAILSLGTAIVAVRFFGIARPLSRYLERLASHNLALGALGRVRTRVYERIEPLAPAQLEAYRDGDLLARAVADVDAMQNLHLRGVLPPIVAALAGAAAVGVAFAYLPEAGAVLAAGLLAAGLVVPAVSASLNRRAARRQAGARGELSAEVVELNGAGAELVAYGMEGERLARVRHQDERLVRLGRRGALAGGIGEGLGLLVAGATVAGVLAVAVGANSSGELDRVLIAMVALLALASFESVQPLPGAAVELGATLASAARLFDLTDQEPAVRDPATPLPPPRTPFSVELESVGARYQGAERPALDGVSLRLDPGRRVALVGPSGSGKTTVVNLLLRFLDPECGRVLLAGRDLRAYRQEDVRRVIAVAGQDSHLFSATIRENIRLARHGASDAEIEDALRRAQILPWITELPLGLDTLVGEEGGQLSGGQRQRLILARALLADAPILVLDEPTAHLDPQAAARFVGDALSAAEGRSVLLITHRPEGLELVDQVIRLEAGRVAER
jgi:thiol reductant ABC exporter CydC subunit